VILSAGLLLADIGSILEISVYVLAVLSTITVIQRVWHVRVAMTTEVT
jgi:hypothetical protein